MAYAGFCVFVAHSSSETSALSLPYFCSAWTSPPSTISSVACPLTLVGLTVCAPLASTSSAKSFHESPSFSCAHSLRYGDALWSLETCPHRSNLPFRSTSLIVFFMDICSMIWLPLVTTATFSNPILTALPGSIAIERPLVPPSWSCSGYN